MSGRMSERRARLALSLVVEPGDPVLVPLLAEHGAETLVAACRGRHDVEVPERWRERGLRVDEDLAAAMARGRDSGLRWVSPGDPDWPVQLGDLDEAESGAGSSGAPLGLWVRGSGSLAEACDRAVAVVGARSCTTYGAEVASDIAADLADGGWTVVSGAAFGIDASAHRGALVMQSPTIAVLACGADVDYPRANAALLARIAEDGLVVSEHPPGQIAQRHRFLSRNRVIAALATGTVVVEAAVRSGSLNTLHWADRLGRMTMAVPGPVTSQQSGGTHQAVREGKAVLVTSGRDVVEELAAVGWQAAGAPGSGPLPAPALRTLDGLDRTRARSITEVASSVRLAAHEVRRSLALLERRGFVAASDTGWVLVGETVGG